MEQSEILYFDIDGTIFNPQQKSIDLKSIETIRKIQSMGYYVALATGRDLDGVKKAGVLDLVEWDGYILVNGSQVYNKNLELIEETFIKPSLVHFVDQTLSGPLLLEGEKSFMTKEPNQRLLQSLNFYGLTNDYPIEKYQDEKIFNLLVYEDIPENVIHKINNDVHIFNDLSGNYELIPIDSGKNHGIQKLNQYLNCDRSCAFGDAENDKAMLEYVDFSVAMGDSPEELKNVADFITKDINDHGVHYAITKFIKGV